MKLDRIEISGFKSVREASLELKAVNLLIGANGAARATSSAPSACCRRSRRTQHRLRVSVAKGGGASSFLHHGPKRTSQILIRLHFGPNGYEVALEHGEGDTLFFNKETCWFRGHGHPKPYYEHLGEGHHETGLTEAARAAPGKVADHVLSALSSWRVYHFHDTSSNAGVKQTNKLDDNDTLRPDASNLAALLYRLRQSGDPSYERIVAAVQQVAPFFADFRLRPDPLNKGAIQLEWAEVDSDAHFNAHALSDGTLRFMCLATLLLQPTVPSLVLVDEPELGLHPYAIQQLAALLQSAAQRTQVLVATQSVTLINQFSEEDVVVVERGAGSTFRRLDAHGIKAWLDGFALGELWEKNVIGGRPERP